MFLKSGIKLIRFFEEETKKHTLLRYALLISVLITYFFIAAYKFGLDNGWIITLLTWSFFVFSTPVADAGFILDLPVRLITGIRMIYSEVIVWVVAAVINIWALLYKPAAYDSTLLLSLFKTVLLHPIPFWSIILLSAGGTFISIYFGDELLDVSKHKECKKYHRHINKYKLVVFLFIVVATILLYNFVLKSLGMNIPLL